ncbi:MAG: cobalamin-dependent protein [Planctomycetes bacterium]|nr:cobalamin-dependent protein [Planctomycetota bacterium]
MRVLFVAAPHRDTFGYSMPPPGLLRLGGAFEREGLEIALLDLAYELSSGALPHDDRLAEAACERIVARGTFEVVGMSVMGATLPIALLILQRLRARCPGTRTWIGGPGTTGIDEHLIARFPCVDVVVRGEGEVTALELAAACAAGREPAGVAGITWRAADGTPRREADRAPIEDMAALPEYAWHLLPAIAEYKRVTGSADGLVALDSGRGCVYDCSFCTIGRYWSRRSRTLPAARLAEEISALQIMPGAKSAYLCHDLFGANRGQAVAFCNDLIARGSPVPFEVRARADHLDFELLQLMHRAGGYRVLIGVESADAAVRERSHKGLRRGTDMLQVVADCARAGITPILSLILGLPGETEAALEASLDLCARACLHAGVNVSLHLVNPEPGSAFGAEFGADARAVAGIPPDMAIGAGETAAERELIAAHPDLFTTFALLPGDVDHLRYLHAIAVELPEILMRYPRTFALLREEGAGATASATGLYRAWKAHGRSFEAFAAARGDDLVRDMLRWEQALTRAAVRGVPPHADGRVMVAAEMIEVGFDLPAVARGLTAGERTHREPAVTLLAITPLVSGSPMSAAATLRIAPDVGELLSRIDGAESAAALERAHPGIAPVLNRFAASGLITFERDDRAQEIAAS